MPAHTGVSLSARQEQCEVWTYCRQLRARDTDCLASKISLRYVSCVVNEHGKKRGQEFLGLAVTTPAPRNEAAEKRSFQPNKVVQDGRLLAREFSTQLLAPHRDFPSIHLQYTVLHYLPSTATKQQKRCLLPRKSIPLAVQHWTGLSRIGTIVKWGSTWMAPS